MRLTAYPPQSPTRPLKWHNGAMARLYQYRGDKRKGKRKGKPHAAHKRHYSTVTGEGVNVDRLFVRGLMDGDTYLRYLREYDVQTRHGKGLVAIGEIRDGKLAYRMTRQEDRFYAPYYDFSLTEFASQPNVAALDSMLGDPPDYRRMMLQERTYPPIDEFCNAIFGKRGDADTWDITGESFDSSLADIDEMPLDSYLRMMEDCPQCPPE